MDSIASSTEFILKQKTPIARMNNMRKSTSNESKSISATSIHIVQKKYPLTSIGCFKRATNTNKMANVISTKR